MLALNATKDLLNTARSGVGIADVSTLPMLKAGADAGLFSVGTLARPARVLKLF
jgi:hypothetical protein